MFWYSIELRLTSLICKEQYAVLPGQRSLRQEVMSAPYVENRSLSFRGVNYVTLNIQGSCNNLCDVSPDPVEYMECNDANISWLKDTI
jgi:hypothetical protein